MGFTKQQERVITTEIGNLIVSAAAGSGKTAVLVERILNHIRREDHPVEIDEMLIVTFTKNAANEMRERIEKRIEKELESNPDDERLQRQARNIHFARISTIDSFCQYVVRRYFYQADIDPSYRILDNSEVKELYKLAMDEVLERAYDRDDRFFKELVTAYGGKKGDGDLADRILEIYKQSVSNPFPEKWLSKQLTLYETEAGLMDGSYMKEVYDHWHRTVNDVLAEIRNMRAAMSEDGMPVHYDEAYADDEAYVADIAGESNIEAFFEKARKDHEWAGLSRKRPKDLDPGLVELCKATRSHYKDIFDKKLCPQAKRYTEHTLELQKYCVDVLRCLCDLVRDFDNTFLRLQKERNAYDFSTISHIALGILLNEDETPTDTARAMSKEFAEIMIDEYQDSNMMQEYLLKAVSRTVNGRPNLFMVGDIKQSIYRFRKAKPELFLSKCEAFAKNPDEGTCINLQMNFRSNEAVIDSVNEVFLRVMREAVGGIDYNDEVRLNYSSLYDETVEKDNPAYRSELLVEMGDNPVEAEVKRIVSRILELTDPVNGLVVDRENPHVATFGDIAVLFRARKDLYTGLLQALRESGIPAYVPETEGYFEAAEIDAVISMLHLLDNPFQEIPAASVLTCPVFGMNAEDLAQLRLMTFSAKGNSEHRAEEFDPEIEDAGAAQEDRRPPYLLTIVRRAAESDETDSALRGKCTAFLRVYDLLKKHSAYTSAAELMEEFLAETGLYEFCWATEGGANRVRNLDLLVHKAREHRETASGSISSFLAYVDSIIESGEGISNTVGNRTPNAVKILTVHGSKGLQYPIVFLADCRHSYNTMSLSNTVIVHDELGFGATSIFPKEKLKYPTIANDAVKLRLKRDSFGEELRLLYVAMTRAKEKLIVTGNIGKRDRKRIGKAVLYSAFSPDKAVSYTELLEADAFLYNVLAGVLRGLPAASAMKIFNNSGDGDINVSTPYWDVVIRDSIGTLGADAEESEFSEEEDENAGDAACGKDSAGDGADKKAPASENGTDKASSAEHEQADEAVLTRLEELRLYFANRRSELTDKTEIPVKVSVSRVKKLAYLEREAQEERRERADGVVYMEERDDAAQGSSESDANSEPQVTDEDIPTPGFAKTVTSEEDGAADAKSTSGTEFGTLCHRILQFHDFTRPAEKEVFLEEWEHMRSLRRITAEDGAKPGEEKFLALYRSELGQRMGAAQKAGKLFRERAFVMNVAADRISPDYPADANILLQGIIDAYFEEDGEYVLVDYKTDRVDAADGEEELRRRHATQLRIYAEALTRGTGKRVKEIVIYSLSLNKSIPIEYNER
ncbi:MAG: helicase-exonuclease AddAB subunit AddA [Lachnospiraceae bacterium]|nr:helicase-exonuclease AddAB subunit AddA [Lachnospiraceae bacterium]